MSKYSFEFKKQVVNAYLNGEGGYTYLANKFGIKISIYNLLFKLKRIFGR